METMNFDDTVRVFVTYCKARGLAPRTVQTYISSLRRLREFLLTTDGELGIPSADQLRGFIVHLLEEGLAKTSVGIHMRSIRCFCNFLAREGIVPTSPMVNVDIPKVPFRYPTVLSGEQIRKLLRACKRTTWTGIRNYTMLLAFLDTGMRLGELVGLDVEDVDLRNLTIRIRLGKGSKERRVFVGRTLFRAMRKWINTRTFSLPGEGFFVTRNGARLDGRNVERIVERLARKAGLQDTRVTPHVFRHTFATHYIMNGGDPFSLQRILGHSDIKTTTIYVSMAGAGLREAHAKASPVDRLFAGK